jgi:protein O-GlcNAc transferase
MSLATAQALLREALTHHQGGRLGAALPRYAQVRALMPGSLEAHYLGGMALLQVGKPADAAPILRRACQIDPRHGAAALCHGVALAQCGQTEKAEAELRRATKLDPRNAEVWQNLASVLVLLNKLSEAVDAYRQSLTFAPDSAGALSGLGSVLHMLGRPEEAIDCHTRALERDPRHPKARSSRAQSWQSLHRVSDALADFEEHLANFPNDLEARSYRLFLQNYLPETDREVHFAEHLEFGELAEQAAASAVPVKSASRARSERLRVAFLSPDLRGHSVAYFLEPLLQHLDRDRFEIILYHDHFAVDATSARLKVLAAIWRNFVGQTAEHVEQQIRADAPDVLVDLAGHTGMNRLPLFARRLAPAQVTYLGYPNTTGLETMDFRFTDAIADPPGDSDRFHTEKIVRFAPVGWAYAPPADAPLPQRQRKEGSPVTFGSFNSLSKINDVTLRLWGRVLQAIPGSRLVLKSFGLREDALLPRLAAGGFRAEQVTCLAAAPTIAQHLEAYSQIDISLDPFPYHGTTTTCEALWMGVPVISLCGDRHASRVGASLLTAAGHPEWIAPTPEAYVKIAQQLAAAPSLLDSLRPRLRSDLQSSPLLDHREQAARFGQALEACWQQRAAPKPEGKSEK